MRQRPPNITAPKPDVRRALQGVLTAGRFILEWTDGINEHRLWADKQKRAAVERQFEVIAEALCRLRKLDPRTWHDIKDAGPAIRLGEAIRRDYDAIDYGILWRATRKDLPELLRQVEELLTAFGS
jgi:uncharacterized protein with HEPN domain